MFNHRRVVMIVCAVLTVLLGALAASKLTLNASFEKMIPRSHPYIQNYLENRAELRGLGNALRIVVENPQGDIYDPEYLDTLRKIHDEMFLTPGVDRAWVKSLWAPGVRWTEVTEEGFRGGPVMPDNYDGSRRSHRAAARQHRALGHRRQPGRQRLQVEHAGRAAARPAIRPPASASTTARCRTTIEQIRDASRGRPAPTVRMHVIGFAKLVGDLIDGLMQVALYFGLAALIAAAIIWLLHALRALHRAGDRLFAGRRGVAARAWWPRFGFELDPYSILVPFLVFAIGVSATARRR